MDKIFEYEYMNNVMVITIRINSHSTNVIHMSNSNQKGTVLIGSVNLSQKEKYYIKEDVLRRYLFP
jgi:hypothetical protein